MEIITLQVEVLNKMYDFLIENPVSLVLIPAFWFGIMYLYREVISRRITPWIVVCCLVVSVLLTMGVVMIFAL